jgi:CheY-like chemotaxis protein
VKVGAEKPVGKEMSIRFEVSDTGIGIPEDKIDRLFKAFSQVDSSTTRKYGGTGLGLAISERLVKLMGGEITVESRFGEGTKFTFNIIARATTGAVKHYASFGKETEGKRILIVDDNPTNLSILKEQLEIWKLCVVTAASGDAAIETLTNDGNFNLVITDMQMPGMDGVMLAEQIKKIHAAIPIILLSSVGDETRSKYPHLFSSVLTKPIKQDQLFKVVQIELRQSKEDVQADVQKKTVLSEDFALTNPLTILIAEDNLINQKLAMRILSKLGYTPEIANNGREAVNMLNERPYDVILMDMLMPEMDGLEATRIIRTTSAYQPQIIAMTANAMPEDREACIKAGMNEYISKPIALEILVKILKSTADKLSK